MYLTPHLSWSELACHCGRHNARPVEFVGPLDGKVYRIDKTRAPRGGVAKLILLAKFGEEIRAIWNKPLIHVVGYRCPAHNAAIGGAALSKHKLGEAIDFDVAGVSPRVVQARLMPLWKGAGGKLIAGLGCSPGYTHADRGSRVARWKYNDLNQPVRFRAGFPGAEEEAEALLLLPWEVEGDIDEADL